MHTLAIRNLHNGKRIDRFVLASDEKWQPEGIGPAATPVQEANRGEYLSRPVSPVALQRWTKLAAQAQGQAEVVLKLADGRLIPLPADGKLDAITGPLQVRVALQREAGQPSPTVRLGVVEYQAGGEAFTVLRSRALELLLERRTGRICGLRDARTGRRYLPDGAPATLFEVETKAYGAPDITRLSSDQATVLASRADARMSRTVYSLAEGKLKVTVTFVLQLDWTVLATAAVDNRSDRDVIDPVDT